MSLQSSCVHPPQVAQATVESLARELDALKRVRELEHRHL